MNKSKIIAELNDKQIEAVTLKDQQNALILAGAGSGKTRVLTHRIAYLITEQATPIGSILAVTFTNKAAAEMRERLSELLRRPIANMWVGTFHGLAHRLLRVHYKEAGLDVGFQILDAADQVRIIKRLMKENEVDDAKFPPKNITNFINKQKDEGLRADDVADPEHNYFAKVSINIFKLYEAHCQKHSLIDFAELLLGSFELLRDNPQILQHYQQQFLYVLIDEFQDTNNMQYQWIKLLTGDNSQIFCVGDDDQSIYGWRGAKIENIQKLVSDFNPLKVIKLEQNYRSTGNILTASNALIANNTNRLGKSLWTDGEAGKMIDLFEARSDIEEAFYVINCIQKSINSGANANHHAILYRTNAQSRIFEDALIRNKIPYIIYGGLRFFDRKEVKDALAYLRLITNPADNMAFERVVNFPPRGIGAATIDKIRDFSGDNATDLFQAAKQIVANLPTRAANSLGDFLHLIEDLTNTTKDFNLGEKVDYLVTKSGLLEHFSDAKIDKTGGKKANLEELINAAEQYQQDDENADTTLEFISLATLDADHNKNTQSQQNVQLMTVHSAKGLEFPQVFLSGLEEGLFPSGQSLDKPHLIAEERRLCYVGMTRAMHKLHLSYAAKRFLHGKSNYSYKSRFLTEIPDKYLNKISQNNTQNTPKISQKYDEFDQSIEPQSQGQLAIGVRVKHAKFGFGEVLNFEGYGDSTRVQIKFQNIGTKWLISAYANLEFL